MSFKQLSILILFMGNSLHSMQLETVKALPQKTIYIMQKTQIPHYMDRYKTPLLVGGIAGLVTNMGMRYFKVPYKGFVTGVMFSVVTSLVAWRSCLKEIKEDVDAIGRKINVLSDEITTSIEQRLKPHFDLILKDLDVKYKKLLKDIGKIEIHLKNWMSPQFMKIDKQNKEMREQLEDVNAKLIKMTVAYNRLFDFLNTMPKVKPSLLQSTMDFFTIK